MNTAEKVALILTLWVGVVGTWAVSSTLAQSADLEEAKRLNNQVLQLYRQGKYAEAAPLAQKALNMNEKALGPDHPYVAISLNNLAALYRKSGREKEAEGLEKRAAAIRAIKR